MAARGEFSWPRRGILVAATGENEMAIDNWREADPASDEQSTAHRTLPTT